jgi:hypothetical protein
VTDFNDRRSRIIGIIAARLGAYFDEAGGPPQELRALFVPDGPTTMETIVQRAVARGELAMPPPARIITLPADLLRHELFMTMTAATPQTMSRSSTTYFCHWQPTSGRTAAGAIQLMHRS